MNNICRASISLFGMALMMTLGTGCSHSVTLQVFDARTQQPIADAAVNHCGQGYDYLSGSKKQSVSVPPTDDRGLTQARGLRTSLVHALGISKAGYQSAVLYVTPNRRFYVSPSGNDRDRLAVDAPLNPARIPLFPQSKESR